MTVFVVLIGPVCGCRGCAVPADTQEYKPDQLVVDLKANSAAANRRALAYLWHIATSRKCGLLDGRKREVALALIPWLDDVDQRKNVLLILQGIGPEARDAVPGITRFVRPSNHDVDLAEAAQYALRDIGEDAAAAVPDLIESFPPFYFGELDDPEYRAGLPITLAAIAPKDPKVRELLDRGLKDEEGRVRVYSALALWRLGVRTAEVKDVWREAQSDDSAVVRMRVGTIAADLAWENPDLLTLAINALSDQAEDVRGETIEVLAKRDFAQAEVMNAYRDRLSDPYWFVRACACEGLGKMGVKAIAAAPRIEQAMSDKAAFVRIDAAEALYAMMPSKRCLVVRTLADGLTDSDPYARSAAAKALGRMGSAAAAALPALRRAAKDEWPEVRKNAEKAIASVEREQP